MLIPRTAQAYVEVARGPLPHTLEETACALTMQEMMMAKIAKLGDALQNIDTIMLQGIEEKAFPGAALWVGWGGETVKCAAYGYTSDKAYSAYSPVAVTTKTLYDLASLTKVVATTSAVMLLIEQGLLGLEEPIATYIPQFATDQQKATITIKQILTHTSGLPGGAVKLYAYCSGEEQIIAGICSQDLVCSPGTQHVYSDLGFILLGKIVHLVSSLRLHDYTRKYVFEPLGMKDTMFLPPASLRGRIAPTEDMHERGGLVHGEVHDENAWALGGVAGHAGLFSTVEDLAQFCTLLLAQRQDNASGGLAVERIIARRSLQVVDPAKSFGLGWRINDPSFMGNLASNDTFGHTGFTGTSILFHTTRHLAIVLLTNRVCPTRNGPSLQVYRQRIADVVAMEGEGEA